MTSNQIGFVAHYHRPPGTSTAEMNQLIDYECLPLLEGLAAVPDAAAGLHFSGTVLQWAEEHRPDLIEAIHGMSSRTELIGGTMHEPFLPLIPDRWRRLQIETHHRLVESLFGREPVGIWLAEENWEPTLAWLLHDLGVGFTLLDRRRFEAARADPAAPAVVDHLGRTVRVLPLVRSSTGDATEGLSVVVIEGPRSVDQLKDAFGAVVDDQSFKVVLPSEAARLPARPAVFGVATSGPGRASLVQIPEANVFYRRMLGLAGERLSTEASEHLMAAQSGNVYWVGPGGGVLNPDMRAATNAHLVEARRAVDSGRRTRSWTDLRIRDWDADGTEEIVVELPDQGWVLHSDGAFRFYVDKPSGWSVADIAASPPIGPRWWLGDRFAEAGTEEGALTRAPGRAIRYELEAGEAARGSVHITMVAAAGGGTLRKEIRARDRTIELTYTLEDFPTGLLGPELPLAVPAGSGRLRVDGGEWISTDDPLAQTGHRFRFEHEGHRSQVLVDLRLPGAVFATPLLTTVPGHQGEVYQGIVLWPHYLVGGTSTYSLSISIVDAPEAE